MYSLLKQLQEELDSSLPRIEAHYETWDEEALDAGQSDDRGEYKTEIFDPNDYSSREEIIDDMVKFITSKGDVIASTTGAGGRTLFQTTESEPDFKTGARTYYYFFPHNIGDANLRLITDKAVKK